MKRTTTRCDRTPPLRTAIVLLLLGAFGLPAVSGAPWWFHRDCERAHDDPQDGPSEDGPFGASDAPPDGGETHGPRGVVGVGMSIEDLRVSDGAVELSLHVDTAGSARAFERLYFGVASLARNVLAAEGVEIGAGLAAYVAANGNPPECDIVIYPGRQAAVASITKFLDGVPYDSDLYGTEFLRVRYAITAEAAGSTTMQLFTRRDVIWLSRRRFLVVPNDRDSVEVTFAPAPRFIRGDVDGNAVVQVTDAVAIVEFIFSGRAVGCEDSADVDDDGTVGVADVISLLGALYGGGPSPGPDCGPDTTPDPLSCDGHECDG